MKNLVWIRSAIVWTSVVVVPSLALFEQPQSGSLGAWLWDDSEESFAGTAIGSNGDLLQYSAAPEAKDGERQTAADAVLTPSPTPTFSQHPQVEAPPIESAAWSGMSPANTLANAEEFSSNRISETNGIVDPMATEPLPPVQPEVPTDAELLAITERLRSLGATYYVLECWEHPTPRYRFRCQVPSGDSVRDVITLESTQREPAAAAREVLEQVVQWERSCRK